MFRPVKLVCGQIVALVLICSTVLASAQSDRVHSGTQRKNGCSLLNRKKIQSGIDRQFHSPFQSSLLVPQELPSRKTLRNPSLPTSVGTPKISAFAIAERALQWMPESLRRLLSRHVARMHEGITEISAQEFVNSTERLRLEDILLQRGLATVNKLQSRPKFSEVASSLSDFTIAGNVNDVRCVLSA